MVDQLLRHIGCDRCGRAWTGPNTQQPPGWIGVSTFSTPLGSDPVARFHLCDECDAALSRFLSNWKVSRGEA